MGAPSSGTKPVPSESSDDPAPARKDMAKYPRSGNTANDSFIVPVVGLVGLASAFFAARRMVHIDWVDVLQRFFLGPGRTSRIILLIYVLLNIKSLPGVWTLRIFGGMMRHRVRYRKRLPPQATFHYSIARSYTSLYETDYNLHKSNSTYFADLDVARTQHVMHLFTPGFARLRAMDIVRDPSGEPARGAHGVALGAVACSFRKELPSLRGFEMWSRVLAWDRKWVYIVTHFVAPAGKVKPASWHRGSYWGTRGRVAAAAAAVDEAELQKHVVATGIAKYVFKIGRFTVHPAHILEQSGLLPERPGTGWRGGEADVHAEVEIPWAEGEEERAPAEGEEWDWRRVEAERRKGMRIAEQFAGLDGTHQLFDGGKNGALGQFYPG